MHEIVCLFAAPIPVGHRIECHWLSQEVQGILSGSSTVTYAHEPMLKDLETGIEYCSPRAFEHAKYKVSHRPMEISARPNPEVQVTHRLVGVVRRCRVITCVLHEGQPIQTHLDVESA